jgi:nucleoside-diphosphate-sugar epimerase
MKSHFNSTNVLITGGLGFLGSNLAHKLVNSDANVTIIDNLDNRYGGNLFNVHKIQNKLAIILADVRDEKILIPSIEKADYIFHFAAQIAYIDSLLNPHEDLELNAVTTLNILEACRKYNRDAKILFSSSRMVIGKVPKLYYDEKTSTNPLSLYGVHKLTSEKYLRLYYKDFGIKSTIYRITNPYGPHQQIKHSKYSLPGWFIRQAMENKTIKIFGEGKQIRDYIYIDDIIEAIYLSAPSESNGEIFNLGSGIGTMFKDMVNTIVEVVGKGKAKYVPWPENYETIETGDTIPDISKLKRISNFEPKHSLPDGIELTFQYYKQHLSKYTNC